MKGQYKFCLKKEPTNEQKVQNETLWFDKRVSSSTAYFGEFSAIQSVLNHFVTYEHWKIENYTLELICPEKPHAICA